MKLTWRDAVATALVAAVVGMYWAYVADVGLPLVAGPRMLGAAALVLGLTACAIGGGNAVAERTPMERGSAAFAVVPGFAGLVALITGSSVSLAILVGGIVVLWLVTTVRHALRRPAAPVDRAEPPMVARSH